MTAMDSLVTMLRESETERALLTAEIRKRDDERARLQQVVEALTADVRVERAALNAERTARDTERDALTAERAQLLQAHSVERAALKAEFSKALADLENTMRIAINWNGNWCVVFRSQFV